MESAADPQLALPGIEGAAVEWVWSEGEGEVNVVEDFVHATVMQDEIVAALAPRDGGVYVDATLGGGGHAEAILERAPGAKVIGIDRDATAVRASELRLARFEDRVEIVRATFGRVHDELRAMGIERVDGICADLGVSSPQLDDPTRGMSFRREGPLDMRMDTASGETALELIERLDDDELANVIYEYGEERRSRRIGGIDPASRTFQALRIAVNAELDELRALVASLPDLVAPGGVAALLSFHSLEDRVVKQAFSHRDVWQPLTKKPVVAADDERAQNPRARSAKMRAARRL